MAKVTMLPGSLPISVEAARGKPRKGLYELSADYRVLARRLELPRWLNTQLKGKEPLLPRLQQNRVAMPELFEGEVKQGDILWRPQAHGFSFPVAGLDLAVYEEWITKVPILVFVLYRSSGKELERWVVPADTFRIHARFLKADLTHTAQFFAPINIMCYAPPY